MRFPLAKEGVPFVVAGLVVLVAAIVWAATGGGAGAGSDMGAGGGAGAGAADSTVADGAAIARWALAACAAALAAFVAWFFRDPERAVPEHADVVVSPADGKVVSVGPANDEAFMDGPATRVAIFLSIFDVHVQRAPLDGKVALYAYHPGGYAAAWNESAGRENERASLGVSTQAGPVLVRQIAGLAARRIATYPREGDRLAKGDRIGLIRFGSRVELFLPADWPTTARPGDRVQGGVTPVAQVGPPPQAASGTAS